MAKQTKGNPLTLFGRWFALAARKERLHDAVALATAGGAGRPSVRYVLLKSADERGFTFFTHEDSAKGKDLAHNPRAAMAFYWNAIGRQVRIEGRVVGVPADEADAYWATRPRGSQLGSAASQQSRKVASRAVLLARVRALARLYAGHAVPRPRHWVGYRIVPGTFEFWTRGAFRLHHRVQFTRRGGGWRKALLQP